MNPLTWKRDYQIALLIAGLIGCGMGLYIGHRDFNPATDDYTQHLALWGATGAVLGAAGGYLRQLLRNRMSR